MATADRPVVRAGVAEDAPALAGVSARAFGATYRGIVPDPVLDEWISEAPLTWASAFANRDPDGPGRIWVAERDEAVIGYATTSPGKDWWLPPPEGAGELTNLYLDPDAIGSGVGRALYLHAVRDLWERGFEPFVVWAFRDNRRAVRFYERMGLVIDVAEHDWILGDVRCPIVRLRGDAPPAAAA
jgi:ribosomal protein S18 acetylase RimI-like enzyme